MRGQPVLDGLQRPGDPVLLPLQQLQRDRTRVMGLQQFSLPVLQAGPAGRQISQLPRTLGHHLIELHVQHTQRLPGLRVDQDRVVREVAESQGDAA